VILSMQEDKPTEITPEMTFGQKLSRALKGSWGNFGEFLRNALVFIIMAMPALLTICALALVIVLIRKAVKKNKSRKQGLTSPDDTDE